VNISIFGLGYVGAVTGACLAKLGHRVTGVDPDQQKLRFIREGKSPILEEGLDDLMSEVVRDGRFTVTDDCDAAVAATEVSLVCVGTPSLSNGGLQTEYVEKVTQQIGRAIKAKGSYHSVVIRSTVLPGTTLNVVLPIIESASGGKVGEAFGLSMHPEFLREGTSIKDFYDPPFTVVGTDSGREFRRVCAMYEGDGKTVGGERLQCAIPTAEAIKYGCNMFHAVKITFANEMGLMCKRAGVDSREVMGILCKDQKLNISHRYLKPGFAFGGSCLPKDLRASTHFARKSDVPLPMLSAVLDSNRAQIERVAERIRSHGLRKVTLMGISFKEATDDLRESPLVHLAELLIGRGYDLRIYDPNVRYAALYGSNKQFIDRELPHLTSILVDADAALAHGEVVVFGHNAKVYRDLLPKVGDGQRVLDLADVAAGAAINGTYEGLYW
jgi:GDP-mannose 6-dehydrogenase